MRSAPPVLVPVGRFVWGRRIVLTLSVSSALLWLMLAVQWWGQSDALARTTLLGMVWCVAVGGAWWALQHEFMPPGELSWDGQDWWYSVHGAEPRCVTLTLCGDAGSAMLLALRFTGSDVRLRRYIWLAASQVGWSWHGLRCAVHARDTL